MLLKEHYDKVKELGEYLIEYEKIDGNDFEKLMKGELVWEKKDKKLEEPKAETEENKEASSDEEKSEASATPEKGTDEKSDEPKE